MRHNMGGDEPGTLQGLEFRIPRVKLDRRVEPGKEFVVAQPSFEEEVIHRTAALPN